MPAVLNKTKCLSEKNFQITIWDKNTVSNLDGHVTIATRLFQKAMKVGVKSMKELPEAMN